MPLDNLSDEALQKIANNQLDALSDDELRQIAESYETPGTGPNQADSGPSEAAKPTESRSRRFIRRAADFLPLAGSVAGGTAAGIGGAAATFGVGGLPGYAIGAGAGAAAGEGVKQAILSALGDQKPTLAQASGRVAKTAATDAGLTLAGGTALKGLAKGGKFIKTLATSPSAAETAVAGKEALVNIAEKGAEKLASARATKELAKKGLIEAEEKAGLHFASTPGFEDFIKDPKKMAKFASKIGQLAKKSPEELSRSLSSKDLQLFRKIAQEGEKISGLSDIANSQLRHGKDVFTKALGLSEKTVGEALQNYRTADIVVGEIPGQLKQKLISQKLKTAKDVLSAKELDKQRKIIKGLAKAGAAYFGLRSLIK